MKRYAALFVVGLVGVGAAVAPPTGAAAPKPRVSWRPCTGEDTEGFDCATFRVPLDHDQPNGRKISLALARWPAADQEHKLGTIFLNPGGPGGSGVDFVLGVGPFWFSDEVRERYDLVGFDPRGITRSEPLRCFRTLDESFSVLAPFAFPVTPDEEALVAELDTQLDQACQRRGSEIRDHMSTADVARDLDLLREAVGDAELNFAGYSYGSFLGVMYANLFPSKVGSVVVDGVLDPIAWTTGRGDEAATQPFSTRVRSDAGALATLEEFFRLCDEAGTSCAFSGGAADRYAALVERLQTDGPIVFEVPETGELLLASYQDVIRFSLNNLYDSFGWSSFAEILAAIEAGDPLAALDALDQASAATLARGETRYLNFVEGFPGVACSDSDNPDGHAAWAGAGAAAEAGFGYFGRIWTWASSPCAVWSGFDDDRYMGPFDHATSNPVLVVSTRFDPATRYEGAAIVDELLPNSVLLTVNGWGHTTPFLSACADEAVSQYLLDGTTPAPSTECDQDFNPFELGAARAQATSADRQAQRAEALEHIGQLFGG